MYRYLFFTKYKQPLLTYHWLVVEIFVNLTLSHLFHTGNGLDMVILNNEVLVKSDETKSVDALLMGVPLPIVPFEGSPITNSPV